MPKINRKLTEAEIRNAKPKDKAYKLYDEGNLYLLIRPTGTKVWQFPYRLDFKFNTYTIGQYPLIGSAEARKRRDEAKALLRDGHDPNRDKEIKRRENIGIKEKTFEFLAKEWFERQTWVEKHRKNIERTFEKDGRHGSKDMSFGKDIKIKSLPTLCHAEYCFPEAAAPPSES